MKRSATVPVFLLGFALLVSGCSSRVGSSRLPAFDRPARVSTTPGIGRVDYLESRAESVLAVNIAEPGVALLSTGGKVFWERRYPGSMIASVKLAPTGDRVFVSLASQENTGTATALWIDKSGSLLWERSGELVAGMYDANISRDGRRVALIALSSGSEPAHRPAFEIVDDSGTTMAASPVEETAAVMAVASSYDLTRHAVTSIITTTSTLETPPDTTVELFDESRPVWSRTYAATQGSAFLSPSGDRVMIALAGQRLTTRGWRSDAVMWDAPLDFVSAAAFSRDDSRLFTMSLRSTQSGDGSSFQSALETRDARSGAVEWRVSVPSQAPMRSVPSGDLAQIALVPTTGDGESFLYEPSKKSSAAVRLPRGTTAACFTDDRRLVLAAGSAVSIH